MPRKSSAAEKVTPLRLAPGAEQRDTRKDGVPTDSGGRPKPELPNFERGMPPKPHDIALDDDANDLWDHVMEQLEGNKLLKPLDGAALEIACHTYARWKDAVRQRHANGTTKVTAQGEAVAPWVGVEERASKEFRAWCAEFGFTPASERKLAVDGGSPDDDDNPY